MNKISLIPQAVRLLANGIDRVPNALLIHGPSGLGKRQFGLWLAHLLLCAEVSEAGNPCGKCRACRLLAGGNHPDFRLVEPEADDAEADSGKGKAAKRGSKTIKIAQIRALESFFHVGSHQGGRRVVLLFQAESMNPVVANSLLKILEEPSSSIYFIITTSKFHSLLPTLVSRCSKIPFSGLSAPHLAALQADLGLDASDGRYLALSGGAPYRVAHWKQSGAYAVHDALIESLSSPAPDPVSLAARWENILKSNPEFSLEELVVSVQRWNFDLALEWMTGRVRYHSGWPRPRETLKQASPHALIRASLDLNQFRRSANHTLNQLMFIESLAVEFLRGLRPSPQ